jgi:dTDP-4-dehydrorhamnose 3,5-epimerase
MGVIKTNFSGLFLFEPQVYEDERGYFLESYSQRVWKEAGVELDFVQDNESQSQYGTLRGLHYQLPPYGQDKLVRVTYGRVLDIVVDLREEEPTYGQSYGVVLSNKNKKQMLIPKGFAHGFVTLSKKAVFFYKCTNLYNKDSECHINPLDKTLNLNWKLPHQDLLLSPKDKAAPAWGDHRAWPR